MKNASTTSVDHQRLAGSKQTNSWAFRGLILGGVAIVAIALIGWLLANHPMKNGEAAAGPLTVGVRMPEFMLQDISGKTLHLSDFKGQTILINTWATWCPPCRAEMPTLNMLYQQYKGRQFTILSINAGESSSIVADFARANKLLFPVLLDPDKRWMNQFGIQDYPTSLLIGKDGFIKIIHVGMLTPDIIQREIQPLIE